MTQTIKMTVPALQRLAEIDPEFEVRLSHAAAKVILEKHHKLIEDSPVVKRAEESLRDAIKAAETEAGEILARVGGEWVSTFPQRFRLRQAIRDGIKVSHAQVFQEMFEEWLAKTDVNALIRERIDEIVGRELERALNRKIGDVLKRG